jgi:hypothetical protein
MMWFLGTTLLFSDKMRIFPSNIIKPHNIDVSLHILVQTNPMVFSLDANCTD